MLQEVFFECKNEEIKKELCKDLRGIVTSHGGSVVEKATKTDKPFLGKYKGNHYVGLYDCNRDAGIKVIHLMGDYYDKDKIGNYSVGAPSK